MGECQMIMFGDEFTRASRERRIIRMSKNDRNADFLIPTRPDLNAVLTYVEAKYPSRMSENGLPNDLLGVILSPIMGYLNYALACDLALDLIRACQRWNCDYRNTLKAGDVIVDITIYSGEGTISVQAPEYTKQYGIASRV